MNRFELVGIIGAVTFCFGILGVILTPISVSYWVALSEWLLSVPEIMTIVGFVMLTISAIKLRR